MAISELATSVNIALGTSPLAACKACDANDDGQLTVNELIAAVNALAGCR